jgi:hypothetical protein
MIDPQFATYEARCTKAAALAAEILPHNKQVLFDALSAAGIDVVTVEFDGSGDSGQFEAPAGFDAENTEVAIPAGEITVKVVDFETGTIREQTTTPREYIETLAYDFLESTHSGWEDGEGANGEFRFSLSERTITLDYNERYVDYTHHEHEF